MLVSGGLDSAVTAAHAVRDSDPAFLHVNYGQRTEQRELESFERIADFYSIKRRVVLDARFLGEIGGSALTDDSIEVPRGGPSAEGIPLTYVPFRNAHLLAMAISYAEVIGARLVYIGVVEEDSSGYPDCRAAFIKAFEEAARLGTRPETRPSIVTPLIRMTKAEIVKEGLSLNAPLDLTWSCYIDSTLACGECDSCILRLRGFREAGLDDPIEYAKIDPRRKPEEE